MSIQKVTIERGIAFFEDGTEVSNISPRLIKAAPKLLEALINLIDLHIVCGDAGSVAGDEWHTINDSDELRAAKAAIAEAEGDD